MTGYESKRAAAQDKLAQPEQEPVACKFCNDSGAGNFGVHSKCICQYGPQRKPLTDEQMREVLRTCQSDAVELLRNRWLYVKEFARAIEAAHDIKENT